MKRLSVCLIAVIAGAVIIGCTRRLVDFTVISSKNVEFSRANEYQRATNRISGEDKVHTIILFPTGVPNAKEALDRAIESVPGAVALLDGVMIYKYWYIPLIYGQNAFIVEGTPLVDKKLASTWTQGNYLVTRIDSDGTVLSTKSISKQEYEEIRSSVLASK